MQKNKTQTKYLLFSVIVLMLQACGGGGGGGSDPKPDPTPSSSAVAISSLAASSANISSSSISSSSTSSSSISSSSTSSSSISSSSNSSSSISSVSISSSIALSSLISSSFSSSSSLASSSSSSAASSSSSSAAPTQLTISGMVTTNSLINSQIEFTVGAQHFTTTVNTQQQYRVTLDVSLANQTFPITAIATGIGSNAWVKLAASLPSFQFLKNLAGSDGTLDSTEFFGVNISPLTTAEFVLANEFNSNLTSDADRKAALLSISAEREVDMASVVTLFLKNINYNLPSNLTNTFDFLKDSNSTSYYTYVLKNGGSSHPAILADYNADVLTDTNQVHFNNPFINGEFLLESSLFSFLLDFKSDGTGRFQSGVTLLNNFWPQSDGVRFTDTSFTWVQKDKTIKVTFATPITYGKSTSTSTGQNNYQLCTAPINGIQQPCLLTLNSISLLLLNEGEFSFTALASLDAQLKAPNGIAVADYSNSGLISHLTKNDTAYIVKPNDIVGYDWYTHFKKYVFESNGNVTLTDLKSNTQRTTDWKIVNNHLVLDNGSTDIWLAYQEESGFFVTLMERINASDLSGGFMRGHLVKRKNINMTSADWVGRWSGFPLNESTGLYDVYADGHWRDGFESQSKGSWSVISSTKQTALSNAYWRMNRDVLAIYNGRYYIQNCQGPEQLVFVPSNCFIETIGKSNLFTSNIFWETWSNPFFLDPISGIHWEFIGHTAYVFSSTNIFSNRQFKKIASNRFYDSNLEKILEIKSSTIETIDICEYDIFSTCASGTNYQLERGIEVGLPPRTNTGTFDFKMNATNGSLTRNQLADIFMAPKNKAFTVIPTASIGYKLGTITGCNGSLVGNEYNIPARTTNCELSIIFDPI